VQRHYSGNKPGGKFTGQNRGLSLWHSQDSSWFPLISGLRFNHRAELHTVEEPQDTFKGMVRTFIAWAAERPDFYKLAAYGFEKVQTSELCGPT
jgi:hypothetical protein